jgi:soluble lytic murein transglycosylase
LVDEFHGQVEYALASYNAGDFRIQDWLKTGNYRDVPEFVESIPFTQTRDYVQAILRNERMYKRLNGVATE